MLQSVLQIAGSGIESEEGMRFNPSSELTEADVREQDAYHEACHAVAAYQTGFPISGISIKREAREGYYVGGTVEVLPFEPTFLFPQGRQRGQDKINDFLVVLVSGEVGTYLCGQPPENLFPGDKGDLELVQRFGELLKLDKQELNIRLEIARIQAKQLLEKNAVVVHALAKVLLEREVLSAEEARQIIRDARRSARTKKAKVLP